MKKIKDLEELKQLASEAIVPAFIHLNYGLRSAKDIKYDADKDIWHVFHYIDDTEQKLTTQQLGEETNIIKALENGALYQYL